MLALIKVTTNALIYMMNTLSGKWVFDTNLLVYGLDKTSRFHEPTFRLFASAEKKKIQIILTQQNLNEAVQVFVRYYKKSPLEVTKHLSGLIDDLEITIISPQTNTHRHFFDLISKVTSPIDIFDYYLAATMLDNNINRILTANAKDFSNIPNIEVINPFID